MIWDEWKQQRSHYLKKNSRIAELEARLETAYKEVEIHVAKNQQLRLDALEERASYESERQRLRESIEILKQTLEHAQKDKAVF